jgi:succinate dehydrogenase/fumarate reductase flavoprotein subunit
MPKHILTGTEGRASEARSDHPKRKEVKGSEEITDKTDKGR